VLFDPELRLIKEEILPVASNKWMSFIQNHQDANVFHTPEWARVIKNTYGFPIYAAVLTTDEGLITSGVPFSVVHGPLSKGKIVSLPYTDHCQPLLSSDSDAGLLAGFLAETGNRVNIGRVELRWKYPDLEDYVYRTRHFRHFIPLEKGAGEVYKSFSRTQRQNIGVAEKSGVEIVRGESLASMREFYRLQCLTRKRQGITVQPWRFFRNLWAETINKGLGFVLLAYKNRICLAGGVFLAWKKTVVYKYAASDNVGQRYRPNHLIIWSAVRWACENGFSVLDFGRCENENLGLRTFKKRWGAFEMPLTYSFQGTLPGDSLLGQAGHAVKPVMKLVPLNLNRLGGSLLYRFID